MNFRGDDRCDSPLVYGFLCEKTNVFYAFDTYEKYQEFLDWLEVEAQDKSSPQEDEMIT
jgi:hypothetical protein